MSDEPEEPGEQLVKEHTAWFKSLMEEVLSTFGHEMLEFDGAISVLTKIYHDCMLHGYKHGYEDAADTVACDVCSTYVKRGRRYIYNEKSHCSLECREQSIIMKAEGDEDD